MASWRLLWRVTCSLLIYSLLCLITLPLFPCSCAVAGSERLAQTNARVGGTIQKEGAFINKSLMFLGVIISQLSEQAAKGSPQGHIPFRDSQTNNNNNSSCKGKRRATICSMAPLSCTC
jgi:hypothetical protein